MLTTRGKCLQELKALPEVLDGTPYVFALEIAVAASRREYLDLQQWLSDRFRQLALPFFQVSIPLRIYRI